MPEKEFLILVTSRDLAWPDLDPDPYLVWHLSSQGIFTSPLRLLWLNFEQTLSMLPALLTLQNGSIIIKKDIQWSLSGAILTAEAMLDFALMQNYSTHILNSNPGFIAFKVVNDRSGPLARHPSNRSRILIFFVANIQNIDRIFKIKEYRTQNIY